MTISAVVDLRSNFGPARDQGQRPTCLAFAASDVHAALRSPWVALSCEYAFYHAQQRGGRGPTVGATLPNMLAAIRDDGQPAEAVWPYLPPSAVPAQWTPPAGKLELYRRAGEAGADYVDALIAELANGAPVIGLLRLSNSFYRVGADGVVDEAPGEKPDLNRRHAVVAVGYGQGSGQRVVLVRNSWGPRWGLQGYAWLTEKFLRGRLFRIAVLKEDLSVPANSNAA